MLIEPVPNQIAKTSSSQIKSRVNRDHQLTKDGNGISSHYQTKFIKPT